MSELKGSIRSASADTDSQLPGDGEHDEKFSTRQQQAHERRIKRQQKRKRRREATLSVLPTLLTLGNGVCGLAAIAVAMSVNLQWDLETKLMVAGVLIFGGMLFDALDGSAARMTGQESEFGAQLDSLCDAITFGTAPAVLVWRYNSMELLPLKLTWGIGVLFALCVLIRLARFNVETGEDDTHEGFEGLPSPAAAGTIAAFAIAVHELASYIPSTEATDDTVATQPADTVIWLAEMALHAFHYVIPCLALVLAFLMVSRFQYPHIFQQLIRGRRSPHQIGQALFILIGAFLIHGLVLPLAFCYYAFRSPMEGLIKRVRERSRPAPEGS
ncbi:CDP-alcohol phosphatidyltransferase family protein [Rubripirellula amarantea]|uniref:CDP-alcohol phosphatidyltransferase n=1 Tax=Rubripirellula amarantea TaxID=2527999 RepID=A0A5C5WMP0_9BACT|nr:CDP-alcohol phosphatidyltransferase family protein [Rubripirellula amarantea]MDA8743344.1 CDP-alcohol phosphatidyltransferase family protein [Rubripirellula amarantea]TWT51361.1 CDP-alcohol phosphatidyltransferase [Rubripirellula amarantea]